LHVYLVDPFVNFLRHAPTKWGTAFQQSTYCKELKINVIHTASGIFYTDSLRALYFINAFKTLSDILNDRKQSCTVKERKK